MPSGRPIDSSIRRSRRYFSMDESRDPCDRLMRITSAPASIMSLRTASDSEAGPMVAMIFVRRITLSSMATGATPAAPR